MTIAKKIAKDNSKVDTANKTAKFEIGKTYYGIDFEDAPDSVKTLTVIKRTAKTLTAIDETGNQVVKRIKLGYAGTKELVAVPGVNDITAQSVNVYADKEYTPATVEETTDAAVEIATAEETAEIATAETKTASEMKANYAASQKVVRKHFTAKGNVAWQCIYHYGLHDREIGFQRISQKEAAEKLTEFGLTPEQVIAVEKAKETVSEEVREICRRENRRYSAQEVYSKALSMVFGEDKPATNVEETINGIMSNAGETTAPNDEPEPESLAPAETFIKTKITSNNNIVVKLNGKRASVDEAKNAILGHDYQINPVKIIDELGEVFIGGTDSDNTVYVFEWRCGQVFEIPFGTNPIQLIARRDLADYRETPASVKPAPKPDSPCAIARGLDDVFRKTFHRVAAPYLDVTTQDGAKIATCFGDAYIEPDWQSDDGYVFTNGFDTFARYDTPQQVIDVMTALRDTIKRGDTEFTFPTVNQSAEPAIGRAQIEDSLTLEKLEQQDNAYRVHGKAFYALNVALRGVPFGAERKQAKKTLDDAFNRFNEKASAFEDSATEIYGKLEEQVQRATEERLHKVSAQVKAMVDAAIDRAQIEDSLTRAMKIALEHYKGFCHIGNLTKAEHELKLYEICRKATRELWEEC